MRDVVIVEAGRSAIGKRGGAFATTHPADLLGPVQMAVLRRAGMEPGEVGQVVGGCINKVGAQAMNITRTEWLSHGGPVEVAELQAAYAQMAEQVDRNAGEYIAADIRFHELILMACHNELLGHLGSTLRATFRASFTRTNASATQTLPMHGAVLDAIGARDGPAAEAAMLELIDTTALQLGGSAAR